MHARNPTFASLPLMFVAATLLLGACATQPTAPAPEPSPASIADWNTVKLRRQALTKWVLDGRAAVATATDGASMSLLWTQQSDRSHLQLSGPFGIGGVEVRLEGETLELDTSGGERLSGEQARSALENLLGGELPLKALRYWLLGVPEPGPPALSQLDEQGLLEKLEQSGWAIQYDRYAYHAGNHDWLPGRVQLQFGELRVRVLINKWQF
jgi:outer membrane lipoprotein LolB